MKLKTIFKILSTSCIVALMGLSLTSCGEEKASSNAAISSTTSSNAAISSTTNSSSSSSSSSSASTNKEIISIADAIKLCTSVTATKERYYIHGTIKSIASYQYGQMTIEDSTGSIEVYGTYSADGEKRYNELEDKPVVGDEVTLYATLNLFNDKAQIKSGWIVEITHHSTKIDDSQYEQMTILSARSAESGKLIKTTGVVAAITYANGLSPNGIYLVDNTNSIYVYSAEIANLVKVGNTITILGEKTYYILEKEQANAAKFGYEGCCQLQNAKLVSNDNGSTDYDKSWIIEKSVKEIYETPITTNITTTIFKTTALIKKVPGTSFVNYYINDLDGSTGNYVYTQADGKDFAWMDKYDGKVCEVYLSALNAKSTSSGCRWRFVPISINDEEFVYPAEKVPTFVMDYYAKGQMFSEYTGDPVLSLINSVSSDILKFDNAKITYTSSNEDIFYISQENNDTVLHATKHVGYADITIKVTYNGNETTFVERVEYKEPADVQSISVNEAIATASNTKVNVKGIIAASLVNKVGFYLVDETGGIAVTTTSAEMEKLSLGQEIVISGTKVTSVGGKDGQTAILDAEVLVNYYGKQDYSTASFVTDKTLADLPIGKDSKSDAKATENIYTLTGQLLFEGDNFSSKLYVVAGDVKLLMYTSSAEQYDWLQAYANQTVKMDLALCNWNGQDVKGSILAIYDSQTNTKLFNSLNFNY